MRRKVTESTGVRFLGEKIDEAVDYCRDEFDISYSEAVGILHYKAFLLMSELRDEVEREQGDWNPPHD